MSDIPNSQTLLLQYLEEKAQEMSELQNIADEDKMSLSTELIQVRQELNELRSKHIEGEAALQIALKHKTQVETLHRIAEEQLTKQLREGERLRSQLEQRRRALEGTEGKAR